MTLTYITGFYDIYNDRTGVKSIEKYMNNFKKLVDSDVKICCFVSKSNSDNIREAIKGYNNVYLVDDVEFEDLQVYNYSNVGPLPEERNSLKDTVKYMMMMNCKMELLMRGMKLNPFNSTHFAWIDFSIYHVFKDSERVNRQLRQMCFRDLAAQCLHFPGCWDRGVGIDSIHSRINWRFCGGFYMGDAVSLKRVYDACVQYLADYVARNNRLVWEVNIWALVEKEMGVSFGWYKADHNESIIDVPGGVFV